MIIEDYESARKRPTGSMWGKNPRFTVAFWVIVAIIILCLV